MVTPAQQLEMTKPKNSDAFRIQRNLLRAVGVWPEERPSIFFRFRGMVSWIWSITFCIILWMEVINDITDITKLSEILYVMVSVTVYLIKLSCMTYHKKVFINTIYVLDMPIFVSYPDDMNHHVSLIIKISTYLGNIYRFLCVCCILLFSVYPLLDNKPLPFPFPYDMGKYRFTIYILQVVGVSYTAWITSCIDTLNASLMGIATAHLNILAEKIVQILEEKASCEYSKEIRMKTEAELKQCVKHHLAIIKFIETIGQIFGLAYMAQFVGSTFVVCNTLFQFVLISPTSSQSFMLGNYFIVMISQLFMYCWFGNEVLLKSLSISDACYVSNWYDHDNNVRKYLFLMMERSRRPVALTVAYISKLSLVAFVAIIQWSYSYFALLLNLYYKKPKTGG